MFVIYRPKEDLFELTTVDIAITSGHVNKKKDLASAFFKDLLSKVKAYKGLN
jgi:hypothetical protein